MTGIWPMMAREAACGTEMMSHPGRFDPGEQAPKPRSAPHVHGAWTRAGNRKRRKSCAAAHFVKSEDFGLPVVFPDGLPACLAVPKITGRKSARMIYCLLFSVL
jgi:hypothetical protein